MLDVSWLLVDFFSVFDVSLTTVSELFLVKQLSCSFTHNHILYYTIGSNVCNWAGRMTSNHLFYIYEKWLLFLIGYTCYWESSRSFIQLLSILYCFYLILVDIPNSLIQFMGQDDSVMIIHESSHDWWKSCYFIGSTISLYHVPFNGFFKN